MKKFFILPVVIAALVIAGCSLKETSMSVNAVNADTPSMLTLVERTGVYTVLVDNATRVMYIAYDSHSHGGMTVMVNADGTPRIWKGSI